MGDGVGKINRKVVIPSDDGVTVTIEGTNNELIKWVEVYVITILKNYHYNGIPEDMQYAVLHNHIRSKFAGAQFTITGGKKS